MTSDAGSMNGGHSIARSNSLVTSPALLGRSSSLYATTPRSAAPSVASPAAISHHQRASSSMSHTRVPSSSIDVSFGASTPRSHISSSSASGSVSGRLADLDVIFKADSKLSVDIRAHHDKRAAAITQLEVCVPLGCLFVLCDGILCMYRLEDLSHVWTFKGAIAKNVSAFSVRLIESLMMVKMGIATAR